MMKPFLLTCFTVLFSICASAQCDPPLTPGAIVGDDPVCQGSTHEYTIAPVPDATSYTWTLPGGWTGTSTTNTITATAGSTGGTVGVTADNTCGSSPSQTLAVAVTPLPIANISIMGPTSFCVGGNVELSANTGTGYSWTWFQGTTPVGTNSTYIANATGNYTVQVTANGCTATSGAIFVTASPIPNVSAGSNSAICSGQTLKLLGMSSTLGATYSWEGPAMFTSTFPDPSIPNAQPANAGVYTLTVTANGCSMPGTTTVVIVDGAPATPVAIDGALSICENSTGNTYEVVNDPNADQYHWTLPTSWSGASATNSITAAVGAAGTYTISVSVENICGISAPATQNITVDTLPTATITQSVNTLTVTSTFALYQWYDSNGLIPGATGQFFNAIGDGTYYCIVTDMNGCTATSNSVTLTVGVNNVAKQSAISLYPNPNNGSFTIEGSFASNDGKASLVIVDVAGRIVHREQIPVSNNKLTVNIDMNGSLAAGLYTIKVNSDADNAVIPVVKK